MKKQTKIITAIVIVVIVAFGGYYGYQRNSFHRRVEMSEKVMKDKGVNQNNTDEAIAHNLLEKDVDLEYAYITHNGENIMLTLKFKKGMTDKDKYQNSSKYVEKVRTEYKGKNINANIIP